MAEANNETGLDSGSTGQKIRIQWYRSTIGANKRHKVLVRSLGFTKLNQIVERPDTRSIRGMVENAPHLLRIIE